MSKFCEDFMLIHSLPHQGKKDQPDRLDSIALRLNWFSTAKCIETMTFTNFMYKLYNNFITCFSMVGLGICGELFSKSKPNTWIPYLNIRVFISDLVVSHSLAVFHRPIGFCLVERIKDIIPNPKKYWPLPAFGFAVGQSWGKEQQLSLASFSVKVQKYRHKAQPWMKFHESHELHCGWVNSGADFSPSVSTSSTISFGKKNSVFRKAQEIYLFPLPTNAIEW